jgi:hypothetical protein
MSLDLNSLKPVKAEEGAVMQVVHPETEEAIDGMTITLLGQDSTVYRKIQLAKQQAILNRMGKGKKNIELDAERIGNEIIEEMVKLTTGWTGFTLDGKELELTKDNVLMVYTDWTWIKDQAQEFVNNRANFFRGND